MPRVPAKDVFAEIDRISPIESRGSLSRWMRENHDQLAARLEGVRPNWLALAEIFDKAGLRDRSGKVASPDTVRSAWARVHKSVLELRAKRGRKAPPPSPSAAQSADTVPGATYPHEPSTPRPKVNLTFAKPADPTVPPQDDGSRLPKPVERKGS
jgi:hypothetical protein